jgi:hypothetical protein
MSKSRFLGELFRNHRWAESFINGTRPAIYNLASASFSGWKVREIPLIERQVLFTVWSNGVEENVCEGIDNRICLRETHEDGST